MQEPVNGAAYRSSLFASLVERKDDEPRVPGTLFIIAEKGRPTAIRVLGGQQGPDSSIALAGKVRRQSQTGQGSGLNGHLLRIRSERPPSFGQLAFDERLNTIVADLLDVAHGLGSRRQLRDCQTS
jgi:hypothetical protein